MGESAKARGPQRNGGPPRRRGKGRTHHHKRDRGRAHPPPPKEPLHPHRLHGLFSPAEMHKHAVSHPCWRRRGYDHMLVDTDPPSPAKFSVSGTRPARHLRTPHATSSRISLAISCRWEVLPSFPLDGAAFHPPTPWAASLLSLWLVLLSPPTFCAAFPCSFFSAVLFPSLPLWKGCCRSPRLYGWCCYLSSSIGLVLLSNSLLWVVVSLFLQKHAQ